MTTRRLVVLPDDHHPAFVVWELTLRCDQPCKHCGSRGGAARRAELDTAEAIDVVKQLARMRTREIALIGGEAYLHPGFLDVVGAITAAGIKCTMVTGGRAVTASLAREMAAAGMRMVSVSVDGLAATHDALRRPGGFKDATAALGNLKEAGIAIGANTSLNRLNMPQLEELYAHLRDHGISGWQLQVTVPLGRAADRPDLLLQPWDLLDVVPRIAALKKRAYEDRILLMPGNNLGYFGPEEALLRSTRLEHTDHWQGCQAGRFILGIESDGGLKGCLSLQSGVYVGGNVRDGALAELWKQSEQLSFMRRRTAGELWGFCATCPFGPTCLAGCTFAAHALFGKPGNNPMCHFRARTHARRGERERLVLKTRAPGHSFDHAIFEPAIEPLDAPDPRPALPVEMLRICQP